MTSADNTEVSVTVTFLLCLCFLPGISLSGPFLLEISVNSLRILAAFLASDLMLDGIGLLTADTQITQLSFSLIREVLFWTHTKREVTTLFKEFL